MADSLLAVDIGTGRVKVGIVSFDGELVAFTDRAYGLIDGGQPGWVEQDAAVWWSETRDAIRAAVASSRGTTIVGACIGGQGPSIVPVDERGEPVAHALIWMDRRAEPDRQRISAQFGFSAPNLAGPGQKDQPVPALMRDLFQTPPDLGLNKLVQVAAVFLKIAHLYGKSPARAVKYRAIPQLPCDPLGVQSRAHDDQAQIRPALAQPSHKSQAQIRIQRTLVKLVQNHGAHTLKRGVALQAPEEHALGHE